METIFSKILAGEIPANVIYEDDIVLAFLDINPINHGHTLIIPKKAFVNIFDGDTETLGHMMKIAQKIAHALKEAGLADGVNLIMNNEKEGGQDVFHAHLHVVPRKAEDQVFTTPKHNEYPNEETRTGVKQKIVEALGINK